MSEKETKQVGRLTHLWKMILSLITGVESCRSMWWWRHCSCELSTSSWGVTHDVIVASSPGRWWWCCCCCCCVWGATSSSLLSSCHCDGTHRARSVNAWLTYIPNSSTNCRLTYLFNLALSYSWANRTYVIVKFILYRRLLQDRWRDLNHTFHADGR